MSSLDDEKIISELKGNTLRAYWALMNSKEGVSGVRELQRRLGFSSPALASYHLNKLADMKLVVKERGDYRLVREVRVGILKQFLLPDKAFLHLNLHPVEAHMLFWRSLASDPD